VPIPRSMQLRTTPVHTDHPPLKHISFIHCLVCGTDQARADTIPALPQQTRDHECANNRRMQHNTYSTSGWADASQPPKILLEGLPPTTDELRTDATDDMRKSSTRCVVVSLQIGPQQCSPVHNLGHAKLRGCTAVLSAVPQEHVCSSIAPAQQYL